MARKRIDSGDEIELGVATSDTNTNDLINDRSDDKLAKSSSKSLKERLQSIGLIAMIICFIIIGFQMTSNDAYSKKLDNIMSVDTPSPTQHDIELVVHDDEGDVEVDVPQKLPPDISPLNQHSDGISFAFRRIATNNNESSSATNANLIAPIRREPLKLQPLHPKLNVPPNKVNEGNAQQINRGKANGQKPQRQKSLINIRSQKGQPYTDEDASNLKNGLPTIEEMKANDTRRFYSDIKNPAKIYGWDLQCSTMDKCDGKQKEFTIISGLYNTGTNVAYKLIAQNCITKMKFQPAWGKHEMPTPEKIEWWNTHPMENNPVGIYSDQSVIVVVIKDPLTWIKSMCKANYDFRYTNRTWFFDSCPKNIKNSQFNWLPLNRAKVMNRNKTSNGIFDSPMHLWNEWYSQITNHVDGKKYPFLIVRFEDLLFRPENVITQFCRCLGQCKYKKGKNDNNIQIADEAAKPHGHSRNRTMSFWSYSNPQYRYDGYTKEDLQFMLDAANITLLQQFGYEFDVEKTKRMRL